jgi:DNA excision repair protein ERCC-8
MALARRLAQREAGGTRFGATGGRAAFGAQAHGARRAALALSGEPLLERAAPRGAGCLCLELDSAEHRLLLAGAADGSVALYDTQRRVGGAGSGGDAAVQQAPVLRLARGVAHAHGCAAAAWYPAGGGLFFTAGLDGLVKGWDAGAGAEALRFSAQGAKVYALALPSCAAAPHGLLAAGAADGRVLLCDPAAGGAAHTLAGHRAGVLAAAWLPGAEHLLVTGGADGAVRIWDIRTAGTLLLLDQHRTAGAGDGAGAGAGAGWGAAGAATAHTGAVTAVAPTPDGRFLLTHGGDGRLRLWCAARALHLLVHYPAAATVNAARLGTRLGVCADGEVVYAPCRATAQPLRTHSGGCAAPPLAGAHYGDVTAVVVHPWDDRVFTAARDGAVMAWAPRRDDEGDEPAPGAAGGAAGNGLPRRGRPDVDAWSDDEETGRGPRMAYRALPPAQPLRGARG